MDLPQKGAPPQNKQEEKHNFHQWRLFFQGIGRDVTPHANVPL